MKPYPIFLSLVVVTRNEAEFITAILREISDIVSGLVSDHEIIVVDNASEDNTVEILHQLASEHGLPNLQVYVLSNEVDLDTAYWAGAENSLGDYVGVIDPHSDDIGFLETMLEEAVGGRDVVFASNVLQPDTSFFYRVLASSFKAVYRRLSGYGANYQVSHYRLLSKRVVNFILQHPMPVLTYRFLPASFGFSRKVLTYSFRPQHPRKRHLLESIDQGMRLLVSTTRAPMRLVTVLALFGALANVAYSGYVIVVAILTRNLAPGWVTLSLQHAGMFLLLSLALLVLAEYILHMTSLASEGPAYHVAQEYTSAVLSRREKLNLEVAGEHAADITMAVGGNLLRGRRVSVDE